MVGSGRVTLVYVSKCWWLLKIVTHCVDLKVGLYFVENVGEYIQCLAKGFEADLVVHY